MITIIIMYFSQLYIVWYGWILNLIGYDTIFFKLYESIALILNFKDKKCSLDKF